MTPLRRDLAFAAALVGVLALSFCARDAEAHGPAHWIASEPRYVDRNGIHCCGETDCWPVAQADLTEDEFGVGYKGQRLSYGAPGIYWVAEPNPPAGMRPFVCVRHGKLICAFRMQPQG